MTGRWQMIAALTLCVALFSVNWTVLNVAQSTIFLDLGLTQLADILLTYAYPAGLLAVLIPIKGRLGTLLWGMAGFGLATAAGALAVNGEMLIACRFAQGLAAAVVLRAGYELAKVHFRDTTWWPAVAIPAVVAALGLTAGPVLGVIITEFLSFRWIFLVAVPPTVVALVTVGLLTPRGRPAP
ncbi:MFS transporter [Nonomuraea sp. NPDC050790]|uniref:MFS transporter n=1 Tax=Nonomuraea sp. NPDC050790 TaxID=3364371 RepID=UPI003791E33E